MFKYDMPRGVLNLNLIQIFSTVGFAVLLGTLNLYLQSKGMPIAEVNILTASFFALNFLLHFLGGSLGGTYLSFRSLFLVSMVSQIIGLLCIASFSLNIILLGMGLYLTGAGLNISCINMMITQRFTPDDVRRRTAFSVNYACMNIGFILGFLVANYFQAHNEYSYIFIFASGCLCIALILHLTVWRYVPDIGTLYSTRFQPQHVSKMYGALIVVGCFLVTWFLMHHADIGSALVYIVFVGGLGFIIFLAGKGEKQTRNKIVAYIILTAAGLIYAFVQGMMGTGLQNFIKYNTTMTFLGIHIEPSGFNSFESFGVIVFGFLLARFTSYRLHRGKKSIPASYLISTGLGINVIAFLMIPLGIHMAHSDPGEKVALIYPILLMVFIALAEILVNAVNYSLAGELIKPKYQGLFTGYLFLNIAVGNNLAGPFSNLIVGQYTNLSKVAASATNPMYMKMFFILAIVAAVVTLIYFFLAKWLHRLKAI